MNTCVCVHLEQKPEGELSCSNKSRIPDKLSTKLRRRQETEAVNSNVLQGKQKC